jgi:hypothetical protein
MQASELLFSEDTMNRRCEIRKYFREQMAALVYGAMER